MSELEASFVYIVNFWIASMVMVCVCVCVLIDCSWLSLIIFFMIICFFPLSQPHSLEKFMLFSLKYFFEIFTYNEICP